MTTVCLMSHVLHEYGASMVVIYICLRFASTKIVDTKWSQIYTTHGAGTSCIQQRSLKFQFSSFIHLDDPDPLHQHDAADHQPVESTNRVTSGKTNDVSRDKNTRKRQNWFPQCLYKAHLNSVFIFRKNLYLWKEG